MQLILRRIAAAVLMAAAALPLFAADMRAVMGEPRATQLQSVLASAIPGSEMTWEDTVTVKLPDGAKSEVHLVGLIEIPRADGPLVFMEIELLDFQTEAAKHVKTFAGTPPPHPTDVIAFLKTNTAGAITAQKLGRLDPSAVSIVNVAEIELRVLTVQCLSRRIADADTLRREVRAWEASRNASDRQVDWQFTADDARIHLKQLYPRIKA